MLRARRIVCLLVMLAGAAVRAQPPMGVTEADGETAVRVWAPHARSVDLVGDFNGWNAQGSSRLAREGDSGIWSTVLKRTLPKGAYQFRINGDLPRRDPYARAVSPDGKNALFYLPSAFAWDGDRPVEQNLEDLVIYEMHVGCFHDPRPQDGLPGTFYDALKRLDHLVDLGVSCVQLMPVHEFPGQHSWGYNPSDLFAVEQAYGGPDGLKTFVKECHRRGLAVHLDIVHNHYGPQNLDLLRFDGSGNATDGGIYFYDGAGINMTPWGPRVKFEEPMVRRFIQDNALMWLSEYHVDGFRWDSTVNIRAYDNGNRAIPAGLQMLQDINIALGEQFPGRLSIAEDSLGIGNFHASWDYDFHHSVVPVLKARNDEDRHVTSLAGALTSVPAMPRVVYVDNHDEAGKLNGQQRLASDVDPSDPASDRARRLCGLGALLTLTAPGIPLLFMGNEMQETGWFHEDRILDWTKRTRHAGLVALHRDLIRLRRNRDGAGIALKGLGVEVPVQDDQRKLLVYWRWHEREPDRRMVIALNLSGQPMNAAVVPFPSAGPWVTRLYTDWKKYGGLGKEEATPFEFRNAVFRGSVQLAPYSARIFTWAPATPEGPRPAAASAAPAPEEPATKSSAFSMYASINLAGTFNDWNLTAWPLRRTQGLLWERQVRFENVTEGEFKLSANENGQVYWGSAYEHLQQVPYRAALRRLGPNIQIRTPLNGDYLVRFNEETSELSIEPVAAPVTRTWTDARGQQVEARFVGRSGDAVTLERAGGQRLQVRLSSLSPDDQDYVRRQAP